MGKIGRIVHIYPDNDLKVEVCGTTWTYSPLAVTKCSVPMPPESRQCGSTNGSIEERSNISSLPKIGEHTWKDKSFKLKEALVKVAANGDAEKCEQILRMPGSDVNCIFAGHTALQAAAQNGHINVIQLLIKYNVDPEIEDKDGDRAIHHAAFGNEPAVIELLTKGGVRCDLNARNKRRQTALHIGVNKLHLKVVQMLVNLHAHVSLQDLDGDTPIHDAITKKNQPIIQILLNANADISICNNSGFNPIHHAALRGNADAIRIIIDKLQEQEKAWLIDEKKEDGFTPLLLACLNNHYEVVKLLIESSKANINSKNLNQQSALHLAIDRQNYNIARLLVDSRCELNGQNKDGDSPMHCVVRNFNLVHVKQYVNHKNSGDSSVLKSSQTMESIKALKSLASVLINRGSDLHLKNKQQQTPLDMVVDSEFKKFLLNSCKARQRLAFNSRIGLVVD